MTLVSRHYVNVPVCVVHVPVLPNSVVMNSVFVHGHLWTIKYARLIHIIPSNKEKTCPEFSKRAGNLV